MYTYFIKDDPLKAILKFKSQSNKTSYTLGNLNDDIINVFGH